MLGIDDINKLQEENEKLKEENYQLQKNCQICENFIDNTPCKPLRDMDYDLQKVINQRDTYIKALEKIKEPATRLRNNKYHSLQEVEDDINLIEDTIDEVLNGRI